MRTFYAIVLLVSVMLSGCTSYDERGFDKKTKVHKITNELYDDKGFDINGYNKEGFNNHGYDKDGYDKIGYNKIGWNRDGINQKTGIKYDETGYNEFGWNEEGFNKTTGTKYNEKGYDEEGVNKDGIKQKNMENIEEEISEKTKYYTYKNKDITNIINLENYISYYMKQAENCEELAESASEDGNTTMSWNYTTSAINYKTKAAFEKENLKKLLDIKNSYVTFEVIRQKESLDVGIRVYFFKIGKNIEIKEFKKIILLNENSRYEYSVTFQGTRKLDIDNYKNLQILTVINKNDLENIFNSKKYEIILDDGNENIKQELSEEDLIALKCIIAKYYELTK